MMPINAIHKNRMPHSSVVGSQLWFKKLRRHSSVTISPTKPRIIAIMIHSATLEMVSVIFVKTFMLPFLF